MKFLALLMSLLLLMGAAPFVVPELSGIFEEHFLDLSQAATMTEAEREEIGYITLSLYESRMAVELSDQDQPFAQAVVLDQASESAKWARIENAYDYAMMASDAELDAAHPELRQRWRDFYQEGLRLRLQGIQYGNTLQDSILAEYKGVERINRFNRWWRQNRADMTLSGSGRVVDVLPAPVVRTNLDWIAANRVSMGADLILGGGDSRIIG